MSLFQFAQPARMRVWTALTRVVARLGLQRILRRIFQLLSWALARSPGPRWRAWAVLTSFWFCDRRPVAAGVGVEAAAPLRHRDRRAGALVAGVGHRVHPARVERVEDAVLAGGADVVAGAGQRG